MLGQISPEQAAEQFAEAVSVRVAGRSHQRLGAFDRALSSFGIARELFAHLDKPAQVGWTLHHEALTLGLLGRSREALDRFAQAETLVREAGDTHGCALIHRRRGDLLRRLGRSDEALADCNRGLAAGRSDQDVDTIIAVLSSRAEIHLDRGDLAQARQDLEEASALRMSHPQRPDATDFLLSARRARCAAADGDVQTARTLTQEARTLADTLQLAQDRSDPDYAIAIQHLAHLA